MEKPILFSGPMVREIMAGTKTQTRRVIRMQPVIKDGFVYGMASAGAEAFFRKEPHHFACNPYGVAGTKLWVRETFSIHTADEGTSCVLYRATNPNDFVKWKPSIFMPRWASRITLEITGVRVERVQEISVKDCMAEGIDPGCCTSDWTDKYTPAFQKLWDSINAQRGHSFDSNPWVWVVSFRKV